VAQSRTAFDQARSSYFKDQSSSVLMRINAEADEDNQKIAAIYTDVLGDITTRIKDTLAELAIAAVARLDIPSLEKINNVISDAITSSKPPAVLNLHTSAELTRATKYFQDCKITNEIASPQCALLRARLRAMLIREIGVQYGFSKNDDDVATKELKKEFLLVGVDANQKNRFFLPDEIDGLKVVTTDTSNKAFAQQQTLIDNHAPIRDSELQALKKELARNAKKEEENVKDERKEASRDTAMDFFGTVGDSLAAYSVAKDWTDKSIGTIAYVTMGIDVVFAGESAGCLYFPLPRHRGKRAHANDHYPAYPTPPPHNPAFSTHLLSCTHSCRCHS
jgi:hypothetical protein